MHTDYSPCSSNKPKDILETAKKHGLDGIAITDHNSAENVQAVMKAAENTPLTVIAGMEVYVREGAHIICLFPSLQSVLNFQDFIYSHLPEGKNDPSMFGDQIVCDENDNIINENERLFGFPTNASLEIVAEKVQSLCGVLYPAHIDRQSYSLMRVLGFIPANLNINAVEIALELQEAQSRLGFLKNSKYSILRASDAHDIKQLGTKLSYFYLKRPFFEELKLALAGQKNRKVSLLSNDSNKSIIDRKTDLRTR